MDDVVISSTLDALFRVCEHAWTDLTPFFPLADRLREEDYLTLADLVELHIERQRNWSGCDQFLYSCSELCQTVDAMAVDGCDRCKPWALITIRMSDAIGDAYLQPDSGDTHRRVRRLLFGTNAS